MTQLRISALLAQIVNFTRQNDDTLLHVISQCAAMLLSSYNVCSEWLGTSVVIVQIFCVWVWTAAIHRQWLHDL